jgi:hypothetical protein
MTNIMVDDELLKYRILSTRFSEYLFVNEFIDDLIRKWLKTHNTNKNIYSTLKLNTIYPFNKKLTKQFLRTIQNIIYNELQTAISYKFKLFDILTEILLVPKNASQMFRNWNMEIENGYICLYRQNIAEKLDKIKLHWDDCVKFAKKGLEQNGFIDDNSMHIFVYISEETNKYNNWDDHRNLFSFQTTGTEKYELTTFYNDEHITLGLHNNNALELDILELMKLGKMKIEITKYNPVNKLMWTIKYKL